MTLARGKAESIALHDCDILTYEKSLLAKLFYPVANPVFNFQFCKGSVSYTHLTLPTTPYV